MSFNNLDEYQNPAVYDAEYGDYSDDFNVFVDLKTEGWALDLACGTGRLTMALENSGLNCIGLDASKEMLDRARSKSQDLHIHYLQDDIRHFNLEQTFDVITMAGNSFQALLTDNDQDNMLSCVRQHLRKDGLFVFNTRNPLQEKLLSTDTFEFWHDFTDSNGNLVRVFGKQRYDSSSEIMHYTTKRVWPTFETISEISLKFTEADTLIERLDKNGFEVINVYGGVDKRSYTKECSSIIPLCMRKE